jgi:hypothetical protein
MPTAKRQLLVPRAPHYLSRFRYSPPWRYSTLHSRLPASDAPPQRGCCLIGGLGMGMDMAVQGRGSVGHAGHFRERREVADHMCRERATRWRSAEAKAFLLSAFELH